jgi:hypothetical protein
MGVIHDIEPFLDRQHTVREIAEKSGRTQGAVHSTIRQLHLQGRVRWVNRCRSAGLPVDVVVSDEVRKWLEDQCTGGIQLSQLAGAILTDAYFDEMEKKSG